MNLQTRLGHQIILADACFLSNTNYAIVFAQSESRKRDAVNTHWTGRERDAQSIREQDSGNLYQILFLSSHS